MGYQILHDNDAVISHRFSKSFDNDDMPKEHLLASRLRMARKTFAASAWNMWVERARSSVSTQGAEPSEGLWANAWAVFQKNRASVERERSYLHGRRTRDEFGYAHYFARQWPALSAREAQAAVGVRHESCRLGGPVLPVGFKFAPTQQQRRAMIALAPFTVQNMPDCFSREPITVLHPASITPEPTNRFSLRNEG